MKKRFAYALVSTLVLGGLVSCGETPAPSTEEKPAGPTNLSIWLSKKDSAAIPALEAKWNELHPTEQIKFTVSQVEEGDVGKKYTEDPEKTPDIAHVPGDVVSKLYQGEHLASFTEAELNVDGFDVGKAALKTAQDTQGVQYGLPFSANTYFLYYNKAALTAEDVKSFDSMAMKAAGKKVMALNLTDGWYIQSIFMSTDKGGIFADNGTSATETMLMNGSGMDAARAIQNLYKNEKILELGNADAMKAALKTGCHSFVSGTWDYNTVADVWGAENVGMAALPEMRFGPQGAKREWRTIGDYKSIVVSANSAHKLLAKKVAVFLDTRIGQELRFNANEGSTSPTSAALLADANFKAKYKFADVMGEVNASNVYQQNRSIKMSNWWDNATAFCNGVKEDVKAGKLTDADLTARLTALNTALLA